VVIHNPPGNLLEQCTILPKLSRVIEERGAFY